MRKILLTAIGLCFVAVSANAYQIQSSKELGSGDAKNQNIIVKCTTPTGSVSNDTCSMRRYAKCTTDSTGQKRCNGWDQWKDLRDPGNGYSNWQSAAAACCKAKGLR